MTFKLIQGYISDLEQVFSLGCMDFYRKYIGKTSHWLCTHFMIPAEKITGPSIA